MSATAVGRLQPHALMARGVPRPMLKRACRRCRAALPPTGGPCLCGGSPRRAIADRSPRRHSAVVCFARSEIDDPSFDGSAEGFRQADATSRHGDQPRSKNLSSPCLRKTDCRAREVAELYLGSRRYGAEPARPKKESRRLDRSRLATSMPARERDSRTSRDKRIRMGAQCKSRKCRLALTKSR